MGIPAMPKTTRETLSALWFSFHNGLSAQVNEIAEMSKVTSAKVQEIFEKLPVLLTRDDHDKGHCAYVEDLEAKQKEAVEHGERRKMSYRDKFMLFFVGVGTLISVVALILERLGPK